MLNVCLVRIVQDEQLAAGEVVSAPDDQRLAVFLGLSDQDLRQKREAPGGDMAGVFIAEGDVVIQRAVTAGYRLRSVVVEEARNRPLDFDLGEAPLYRMTESVVEVIASHRRYRGAMACFERPEPTRVDRVIEAAKTVLVTERVNNPTNMGVMIRTAAALGVDAILVDPTSCDPLARRANRVSMGAVFAIAHARLDHFPEGLSALSGFVVVGLTPSSEALNLENVFPSFGELAPSGSTPVAPEARVALLVGAEAEGLSGPTLAACDHLVRIPMHHGVDSLNVAIASAIAMYAAVNR